MKLKNFVVALAASSVISAVLGAVVWAVGVYPKVTIPVIATAVFVWMVVSLYQDLNAASALKELMRANEEARINRMRDAENGEVIE